MTKNRIFVALGIAAALSTACGSDGGASGGNTPGTGGAGTDSDAGAGGANEGGAGTASGGKTGVSGSGNSAGGNANAGGSANVGGGANGAGGGASSAGGNANNAGGNANNAGGNANNAGGNANNAGGNANNAGGSASGGKDCVGGVHLATQHRTRFQAASVPAGNQCVSQEQSRTCNDGQWSTWTGTYTFEACTPGSVQSDVASCLVTSPVTQCSEWEGTLPGPVQCPSGTIGDGCPLDGAVGVCEVEVGGVVNRSFYYSSSGIGSIKTGCEGSGGTWKYVG